MISKATRVGFIVVILGLTVGGFLVTFLMHSSASSSSVKSLRDALTKKGINTLCFCEYIPDVMLLETSLATINNTNKEDCCRACILREDCKSWSFLESQCYLKDIPRDDIREHSQSQKGAWTGLKCIPHPPLTGMTSHDSSSNEPTQPLTTEPLPPPPSLPVFESSDARLAYLEQLTDQTLRQLAIQEAISHAWRGYADICFGQDDLKPLSRSCDNWLGAQGNTLIDSMSTLYLAGLNEDFAQAQQWVANKMNFNSVSNTVSHFETVIRVLGGLLSAFDLSGEEVFLSRARELGNRMTNVFSSATGMPFRSVTIASNAGSGDDTSLADIGTVTMEYFSLSHSTGEPDHRARAHHVTKQIQARPSASGMYGNRWNVASGANGGSVSFGGEGDSFYEYLLKLWLLTGRNHELYRTMYQKAAEGLATRLVRRAAGLTWVADSPESGTMGHLACFVPGMLALGASSGAVEGDVASRHLALAEELGSTCYRLYESQPTGIGPENVRFSQNGASAADARYINRPETTEGIFYLWRVTKKQQYREWGWKIFLAMEKHCRADVGYTGLQDVTRLGGGKIDKMESFFIAETLKYLYLLQSSDETLPLAGINDDFGKKDGTFFVLNTEAHPLRSWNDNQPLRRI